MRRIVMPLILLLALAAPVSAHAFPATISLPNGFAPEGIAVGRGSTFYTGSLAGGGIFRGDLRTGDGEVIAPSDGRTFVGMKVDHQNRLWVAGGPGGAGYVLDARSGETLATIPLADTTLPTFVNDVVVTRNAAWFTDSMRPVLYRVAIGLHGAIGPVETLDLTGEIEFVPGEFNLNGIDASPSGQTLIIVNSFTGTLYAVDARDGNVTPIDLGGASVASGDGILLVGHTLYVVRNFLNEIAVVLLRHDLTRGEVVDTITSDGFDVPTTVARFGHALYLPNARFTTPVTPDTEYWVTRVER